MTDNIAPVANSGPAAKDQKSEGPFKSSDVLMQEFQLLHPGRAPAAGAAPGSADHLARYHALVHGLPGTGQAALCLSGGGVRSAAFAFGILQGLARRDLLRQFDYLSTVSGGGYIGTFLTAWMHRADWATVSEGLKGWKANQLAEPAPIQRLRFYHQFLTPKAGLTSADSWTAVAIITRNLILNWLVFASLIVALLLVPRIVQSGLEWFASAADAKSSLVALLHTVTSSCEGNYCLADLHDPMSWADSLAVLLVLSAFVISAANRPASGESTISPRQFTLLVLVPASVGALLLVAAVSAWIPSHTSVPPKAAFLNWVVLSALIYGLSPVLACFRPSARRRKLGETILQIAAWAISGACVGVLLACGDQFYRDHVIAGAPSGAMGSRGVLAVFGFPWVLLSFLAGEILYVGLTSKLEHGDQDREWLGRAGGYFAATALFYLLFSAIVILGWNLLASARDAVVAVTAGSGLLTIAGSLSSLTAATRAASSKEKLPVTPIVSILAAIFILCASILLSHWSWDALYHVHVWVGGGPPPLEPYGFAWPPYLDKIPMDGSERWIFKPLGVELAFLIVVLVLIGSFSWFASLFVNVNSFSLHALYRNRLIRAFMGASNIQTPAYEPERNAFDDFSDLDNIRMKDVRSRPWSTPRTTGLFHVVNMTLNVVATKNLAWQDRKAESFISTPLFTGNDHVHYRRSEHFAQGITLGTAMAISGAAVSPNWGYHSSAFTSFLMMLFNIRLGWWFGNPRHKSAWRQKGPKSSIRLFIQEALGKTGDDQPYIYLSDGGHFENLGLYEMIRRRCRTIVVSDAGADPEGTLEDLGNAVRKIAIDLGVTIEFERIDVQKRAQPQPAGLYCAIGTIYYPEAPDARGTIVYIKPGYYGHEPADVRAYAARNAKFPHESTINQWFTESQFESYRSLGTYVVAAVCGDRGYAGARIRDERNMTLEEFVALSRANVTGFASRPTPSEPSPSQARP